MSQGYPGIALLSNELTNTNVSPVFFLKYIVVLTTVRIWAPLSQLLLIPMVHVVVSMSETLAGW